MLVKIYNKHASEQTSLRNTDKRNKEQKLTAAEINYNLIKC